MNKISAVYQIINTVSNDRYVGSSRDVKQRWVVHKCPSTWKKCPNNPLYRDFQKYGVDNFRFQILAPVQPEYLKQVEQEFIDLIQPAYNSNRANGWDVEKLKEWRQSDKGKESHKKSHKKYYSQLCLYNGETLKLNTLAQRFYKAGIKHATIEAKKYLFEAC